MPSKRSNSQVLFWHCISWLMAINKLRCINWFLTCAKNKKKNTNKFPYVFEQNALNSFIHVDMPHMFLCKYIYVCIHAPIDGLFPECFAQCQAFKWSFYGFLLRSRLYEYTRTIVVATTYLLCIWSDCKLFKYLKFAEVNICSI